MIDELLAVPPYIRERLACALEVGLIDGEPSEAAIRSVAGSSAYAGPIMQILAEFRRFGLSSKVASTWLRSMNKEHTCASQTDLVWSGPEVAGLHARDTRQVYEELLGSAKRSLWVSTYVFFDGPKAFEVLARRMDTVKELQVTMLLNIQRKRGDTTVAEQLVRSFADRFWSLEWPGTIHPRVFYDPRALDMDAPGGVLHAKAVVSDDEMVFITSANLTEAAMDRNIELGLLVRDQPLAGAVIAHFRRLIDLGLLHILPKE